MGEADLNRPLTHQHAAAGGTVGFDHADGHAGMLAAESPDQPSQRVNGESRERRQIERSAGDVGDLRERRSSGVHVAHDLTCGGDQRGPSG